MSDPRFQDQFAGVLRLQQIFIVALVIGCVTFAVVAIGSAGQGEQAADQAESPFMTYIALAYAVMSLPVFFGVRAVLTVKARGQARAVVEREAAGSEPSTSTGANEVLSSAKAARTLILGSQVRLIVGAAILEGAAFFLLFAYFFEGEILALGVAGVMTVGVAALFPTRAKFARWIVDQAELIRNERQLPGS